MNMARKIKRTIVFILKLALFATLFGIYFGIFGINNPWLFDFSRTTGVTMIAFVVLGIALMSIYGGYAIGVQKSKPIIYNMTLATVITDIFTHLLLSIMKTTEQNVLAFTIETPHLLLLVMLLQIIAIIFFAYFGNFIYFCIEPPEKTCIISSSTQSLGNLIPKICRFKKQYVIKNIIYYQCDDLYSIINENDTIFIYDVPTEARTPIVEYCYQRNLNVYYNFEMCDVVSMSAKTTTLDDKPFVTHAVKELTFEQRFVKRIMDIIVSLILCLITSPIMILCACLIKAEDGGKIFYTQKRLTRNGKIFNVLKFRTMKEHNSINQSVTENDDRITKIGNILRRFRVDELPQFFNILKGDMTIVGPRPEMIENVTKYTDALPEFSYRLRVKAGLTGLAQISGKYNTSPKDKLVLDLHYIENFSIWQDFKIILQTITVFFKSSDSTQAFGAGQEFSFDEGYGPKDECIQKETNKVDKQ